jgi:hypothetical protein
MKTSDQRLRNQVENWPTPMSWDAEKPSAGKRATADLSHVTGLWHTPNVPNRGPETAESKARRPNAGGIDLQTEAELWPTASARDWKSGDASDLTMESNARPLNEVATHWPTPNAVDETKYALLGDTQRANNLSALARRGDLDYLRSHQDQETSQRGQESSPSAPTSRPRLNPAFVEWMMGFQIGWTDSARWETPSCPTAPPLRSECSTGDFDEG